MDIVGTAGRRKQCGDPEATERVASRQKLTLSRK